MNIDGKTVLVTGGARRVGAELVRAFAAAGADIRLHVRRSRDEAGELAASLPAPERCRILAADLAVPGRLRNCSKPAGRSISSSTTPRCSSRASGRGRRRATGAFRGEFLEPARPDARFCGAAAFGEGAVVNLLDQEVVHGRRGEELTRCRAARWPMRRSNSRANSAPGICASTRLRPVPSCPLRGCRAGRWRKRFRRCRCAGRSGWPILPKRFCSSAATIRSPERFSASTAASICDHSCIGGALPVSGGRESGAAAEHA